MNVIALLIIAIVWTAIMPVMNSIQTGKRDFASNNIRQDAQPKKAIVLDPAVELEIKHEVGVTALAYSPDGRTLATGDDDYSIQLWDAGTGQFELKLTQLDRGVRSTGVYPDGQRIYSLAFSPDGKTLASAGDVIKNNLLVGGRVTLWEIPSGKLLRTIIVNNEITTYTKSVVFAPDGKSLVTGMTRYKGMDAGEISEWNVETGALERKWKPLGVEVYSVTFSPDGRFLAVGCSDGTIKFWDLKTRELHRTLEGGMYRVFSLSFSPDGGILASCVGPGLPGVAGAIEPLMKVHYWDAQTGRSDPMRASHRSFVTAVAFSPHGQHLASGDEGVFSESSHKNEDGTVKIWRLK